MSDYTPGPWQLLHADQSEDENDIENSVWAGEAGKEQHVAVIRIGLRQSKANAHLIAAAPDLLEACKAMLADPLAPVTTLSMQAARAAIAKAEGQR